MYSTIQRHLTSRPGSSITGLTEPAYKSNKCERVWFHKLLYVLTWLQELDWLLHFCFFPFLLFFFLLEIGKLILRLQNTTLILSVFLGLHWPHLRVHMHAEGPCWVSCFTLIQLLCISCPCCWGCLHDQPGWAVRQIRYQIHYQNWELQLHICWSERGACESTWYWGVSVATLH